MAKRRASPRKQSPVAEEADKDDQHHHAAENKKDDHDGDDEGEEEARRAGRRNEKKKQRILTEPNFRQNDVLFGRGSSYNSHNKETVWRSFVDHPHFKTEYQHHSHKDRYAKQVIGLVRANSRPPTRFLIQRDVVDLKSWTEADEDDIIEKTKRKLREKYEPSQNIIMPPPMPPMPPEITMLYPLSSLDRGGVVDDDPHQSRMRSLPSTGGGGGGVVKVTPGGALMMSEMSGLKTTPASSAPGPIVLVEEEQATKKTAEEVDEERRSIAAECLANLPRVDDEEETTTSINDHMSSKEQAREESGKQGSRPLDADLNRQESDFSFSAAMLEAYGGGGGRAKTAEDELELGVCEELRVQQGGRGGHQEQVWTNTSTAAGAIGDTKNNDGEDPPTAARKISPSGVELREALQSRRALFAANHSATSTAAGALTTFNTYDHASVAAVGAFHASAPAAMAMHHQHPPPSYPTIYAPPHFHQPPVPRFSFKLEPQSGAGHYNIRSRSSNHRNLIRASTESSPSLDSFLDSATLTLNSNFAGVEAQVDILAQDVQPRELLVDLVKQRLRDIKNYTDFIIARIRSESTIIDDAAEEDEKRNEIGMSAVTGV